MSYKFDDEVYLSTGEKVKIKTVITKEKQITYRLYDGRVFSANDFFQAPEPKKKHKKKKASECIEFNRPSSNFTKNIKSHNWESPEDGIDSIKKDLVELFPDKEPENND